MIKSPFKFLDSYTKDDRGIFFGRDREIEELYQRVFESKLLLVYGVSGTGKSSLIHCGLANKFQETDWLPLVVRRGGNILESMAAVIKSASITSQEGQFVTPSHFKKGVKSLYLDHYKPIFFLFDQFEELFIFGNKEEKHLFIQVVKSLLDSDLQCRFIFILREEYMANITEFERYITTIFSNRVRVEKMSHINAIQTIKEPCKAFNINLEEGFAETLMEKLCPGGTDVELTYLQVFLDKIFRLASINYPPPGGGKGGSASPEEGVAFTLDLLQKTGNVSDLLGSFLDDQISLMDNPDLANTVLKAFVSGKGTKRQANETDTIDNVRSLGKEISPEMVTELLQTFVRLRVLRDKDDHGRYELRHDALAEKIYEKFSLAEKELLEIRQLIENSYQSYLKRKILLSNDDLLYISNKDSLLNLNSDLLAFIIESRKHQKAKAKTVRRLTAISALSFVILICTLGYYIITKLKPTRANIIAVNSLSQSSDLQNRLSLAGRSWNTAPGALPREALLKSFNEILNSPDKDTMMMKLAGKCKIDFDPAPVNIKYAECSKDNRYVFGYGDSLILVWNLSGKLERVFSTVHYPIIDIKMSDDSRFIGAVSADSILAVWNVPGELQFFQKIQYNELNTKQIFKFTKENNLIALSNEHDVVLIGYDGKVLQVLDRHKGRVNAVDISSDNNFIATASDDSTIIIWYRNTVKNKYDFYKTLGGMEWTGVIKSVSFSKNNITVITDHGGVLTINGDQVFWPLIPESLRDTFNKTVYSAYACFSGSDEGIINMWSDSTGKIIKGYSGGDYKNPLRTVKIRTDGNNFYPEVFDYLAFSNDDNYFIYTRNSKSFLGDNNFYLAANRSGLLFSYTLLSIEGNLPFFTGDSRYVISIKGNKLVSVFVDINTIYSISRGNI
jgi:WD40 repeat protein